MEIIFYKLETLKSINKNSIFNNIKIFIENLEPIKKYLEIEDDNKLIIAFARMEDLHNKDTHLNLINNKNISRLISDFYNPNDYNNKIKNYKPLPIIVIGFEDFVEHLEFKKNQLINNKDKNKIEIDNLSNQIKVVENLNLDQRVKFFDSSIWHRYVPLDKNFITNFEKVINEIVNNMKLYQTSVSREFLEFKTRMMVNSYLAPVGKRGHASHLVPYKFHSESTMKSFFDEEIKEVEEKFQNLRWKFLLIDDYAMEHLRSSDDSNNNHIPTKAKIMKTTLEDILGLNKVDIIEWTENWKNDNENKNFLLWVRSITDAKEALKAEMFDIIFLDYLFTEEGKLGSELLKEILKKKNENLRKNIGPLEKFWIFPISAFSYAMMDDLRESGLGYYEDYWHISSGSDPINTPWLFKYKLIKFFKLQIELLDKTIPSFFNEFHSHKIDIQESAQKSYATLTALRKDYYSLIQDNQKKSLFAKSILEYFEKNNAPNHIWEHLNHLIYLLAFGSGTEWAEMWEEYTFIKNYLDGLINTSDSERCLRNIKKYIIDLQKEFRN